MHKLGAIRKYPNRQNHQGLVMYIPRKSNRNQNYYKELYAQNVREMARYFPKKASI